MFATTIAAAGRATTADATEPTATNDDRRAKRKVAALSLLRATIERPQRTSELTLHALVLTRPRASVCSTRHTREMSLVLAHLSQVPSIGRSYLVIAAAPMLHTNDWGAR